MKSIHSIFNQINNGREGENSYEKTSCIIALIVWTADSREQEILVESMR